MHDLPDALRSTTSMHLPTALIYRRRLALGLATILACSISFSGLAQQKPASHLKDEMRTPWIRSNERFLRSWQVLGEIPLAGPDAFAQDSLAGKGGEANLKPDEKAAVEVPNGPALHWRAVTAWADAVDASDGNGLKRDLVAYAFATVSRTEAGKALLCLGSDESIRVWLNGVLVDDHRGPRPLTFDEDRIEVDLKAGENSLLVKLEQRNGPWTFAARVLERGAIPPRSQEIGPSFTLESPSALAVRTDINRDRATEPAVTVQAVAAGGKILAEQSAARGDSVRFDPSHWPDGAYEIRCNTLKPDGRRYAAHLAWYKGDAIAKARELVAAGAKADPRTPRGMTVKMLADMVRDRLGPDGLNVAGNPWWAIHSPLMEFAELQLEAAGETSARERAYGFFRLAWQDEVDGSPQFCRAYLPGGYDRSKKWPLVVRLHGYNGPNPVYVRWWAADGRHSLADAEYGRREGIILIEPHGRGNTGYFGLGDADVVRAIQQAKAHFNVDDDRVYLTGESMGGNGTWNVGTRHPDLFAALAPYFGGADYHSYLTEEQLAELTPLARAQQEQQSSWAMAEGLLNVPVFVHHGDVDQAVNVDFSRYGVRLLQRWGYDVRYMEMPGYQHEDLNQFPNTIDWFLRHRRNAQPRQVRLHSIEPRNASAYWVAVETFDHPDRFIAVDAEVVGANTIRVDSQNVLALTLTPGAALLDATKPVQVVWNGAAQTAALHDGRITLRAPGYQASSLAKNADVAGPVSDIFNTPFAIVTGTASADPAMNEVCRQKTEGLATFWQEFQRQPPRVFKDSEITDPDLARYSLVLIGGPDANLAARKLADRLPLQVAKDRVTICGRSFAASDARVQMIFPHPLNPRRYVLIAAASSPASLQLWSPGSLVQNSFDFTIEDGHVPDIGQKAAHADIWVAGGWFGRDWSVQDDLTLAGKPEMRAKSLLLQGPLDPKLLGAYVGTYEIVQGPSVKVMLKGDRLAAQFSGQPALDLIPAGENKYYIPEGPAIIAFEKNSAGKVSGFKGSQNGQEFSGKKTE